MTLKRISFALFAVLALSAMVANGAMANPASNKGGFWYKNNNKLVNGEANGLAVSCAINGVFTLKSTIGLQAVKLKATGVTCPGYKIFDEGGEAKGKGKIKFETVTVEEPALMPACTVTGGVIQTNELITEVWMEEGSATKAFQRFSEAAGGEVLGEVEIEGCVLAGSYPLKGKIFAEMLHATGENVATESLIFSPAINTGAGGTLKLGIKPAELTGRIDPSLTGGGNWKVNET